MSLALGGIVEILAAKSPDVLGSVWLATALLSYDATRGEPSLLSSSDVAFRQSDIVKLASRLCSKTVHQPRVQQWANGDHEASTTNYLRAVGSLRRLAAVGDFEGERTLPWELHPQDAPVASWSQPADPLTFGGLVDWVVNLYSEWALVFPEAITTSVEPRLVRNTAKELQARVNTVKELPQARVLIPRVEKKGFSLESVAGAVQFEHAPLRFEGEPFSDAFANLRSSIPLGALLEKGRYASLAQDIRHRFSDRLTEPLGRFLAERKAGGDAIYLRFLNAWGDRAYRRFRLDAPRIARSRGVYAFVSGGVVRYIGRSRDPFSRRIEQGYGSIAPGACFLNGQSTNCKVNALATAAWPDIEYFVHVEQDEEVLMRLEEELIARYRPDWNGRRA